MGFGRLRRVVLGATLLVLVLGAAATGEARPGRDGPPAGTGERGVVERVLHRMSLEEKVGQMFVTYAYGDTVEDRDPEMVAANREAHGVEDFRQLIERYHLGGIIYFAWSGNVENPQQIAALSNGIQRVALGSGAGVPMLISTDQEQGVVVRVDHPATQFPGNMALGAGRSPEDARTAAAITGEELRAIGINQNFAPVADVNVNPRNPVIGVRSFGEDPGLVSELTAAQVRGYQGAGVAATAKHFPGHGDTDVDSHYGLPVINHSREELERVDLPPFEAAIEAGVDSIMTAHIVVPALDDSGRPATLSRPILTGLLRKEMGFDGVIVTDSLGMAGVRQQFGDERVPVEAIKAGADMLLMPPDIDLAYNAVLEAVRSGEIKRHRIDASVRRILALKLERGLFEDPFVDESRVDEAVGTPEHHAAATEISDRTVTLVKNEASLLPLEPGAGREVLITGAGGYAGSAADQGDRSTLGSLAAGVEGFGDEATVYETGTNPDASRRERAVSMARESDLVVVTTNKAWTSPSQQQLVRELLATGKPVIVAAVRDPYDIAYFDEAPTYLATYGYKPVSMESLARVLFGEVNPAGRLPVTIPEADDPDAVLYPYGHGLGY